MSIKIHVMNLLLIIFVFHLGVIDGSEKIKLKNLQVLTLYQNRLTTARRSTPIPQLRCIGGSAKCDERYLPSIVQCENKGYDGATVQWRCQAEMPSNMKFGSVNVNCEGYDYPNDKNVLVGSCGLSYTLDRMGKDGNSKVHSDVKDKGSSQFAILLAVVGVVIFCVFVYSTCIKPQTTRLNNSPNAPERPPPPGFRPEFTNDYERRSPPAYEEVYIKPGELRPPRTANQGWGSFLTGALAGGLGGYFFGSSNTNRRRRTSNRPSRFMAGDDFTINSRRVRVDNDFRRRSRSSSRNSNSDSLRTSYGYGGTTTR